MDGNRGPDGPSDASRAAWTRDHASELRRDESNVAPVIYPADERVDDELHIWDTWFLRERGGEIAEIDGYRVIVALTASSDLLPGKRHDVATLRYFYSEDGENWETGGPVFEGEAFGSRQWAGSVLYDDGDVYCYYTAAGRAREKELSYSQRIALAEGGRLTVGDGVSIDGPWEHSILLEPDGELYETEAQYRGMTYTFRDPWFFEDPASGETYLLFEANTPVPEGSDACGGDPAQQEFNGSVGIAHSPTGDPTDFELRPPLLDAVCVNQELERPHLVVRRGRYYLFVSSHVHTFAPGLEGYDALYGFVADELRGDYEPLNGHGMVVTNPAGAPFQAYSWLAYDHGDELLATSFFNYHEYDRPTMDDVALLPEDEQRRRFGGTLAPTVRIELDGAETRVRGALDHGHLPLPREGLPEPWWTRAEGDDGDGGEY
ncbi:glycoside hydrolase family 68 protein [Halopelagius longus]|uniref:Glycoside hydrolase family 68 protein n=1 Tax=Halopelagius longus TaxID=1236180 RepID=A0A1H0XT80_9EURY|nr:glycoside hydrolase family 68 protein [Halopelagius longus]RDI72077.1 glycoside hydrolase family 68 protein [Halopelagius longus]SDQ06092.1 levansucrase [Halopelagius longus]